MPGVRTTAPARGALRVRRDGSHRAVRAAGRLAPQLLLAASLAASLAACTAYREPSAGATVSCATDAECPSGWSCRPALGACRRSRDTGLPPSVATGSTSVSPAAAAAGTQVVVRFEVSAPLHAAPVVELDTSPRTPLVLQSVDGRRYAYSLVVAPSAAEGFFSILAALVGEDGAVARELKLGDLVVDRTPPAISRVDTLTPAVRAGAPVVVEVTLGEPLGAPSAHVVGGPTLTAHATDRPQVWRFEGIATGAEVEGPAAVEIQASDAAGNTVTRMLTDAFSYDFTAPRLEVDSLVLTSVVRQGQEAAVHLDVSEPLSAPPIVELVARRSGDPLPLAVIEHAGTAWTFGRLVAGGDPQETFDVRVTGLADLAGNPGVEVVFGALRIDSTPPRALAGPALDAPSGLYRAGDRIAFSLTLDEPLSRAPVARLETTPPRPFDCVAGASRAEFTCTLRAPLDGTEVPESVVRIVAEFQDDAGNAGIASATATLDFTAPAVVPGSPGLALTPPPGALVPAVGAATAGTRVRLSFSTTEPLAGAPEVGATSPEPLPFVPVSQSGTHFEYETVVPPGAHAAGAYAIQARLADVAGNVTIATLTLPGQGLVVDTSPPAPPDVEAASRITYARLPWGSAATSGRPTFTITGLAGAVEGGATVIAYDGPDPAGAREIGRATAADDGSFPAMALVAADRTRAWVLQVDAAGNASDADPLTPGPQAVGVRDVTWTATLSGDGIGVGAANPHVLEVRPRFSGALVEGVSSTTPALPASTRGTLAWVPVESSAAPSAIGHAVFDARRDRVVVLNQADLPGAWEWNGRTWVKVLPAGISADGTPTTIAGVTYDERRQEVVVFDMSCTPRLWAWDGRTWAVRAANGSGIPGAPPATGPNRLLLAVLGYDRGRGETVVTSRHPGGPLLQLCGGWENTGTWAWTGTGWRLAGGGLEGNFSTFFDPTQGTLVAVGDVAGVQRWTGSGWSPAASGSGWTPNGGEAPPGAFDPASQRIIRVDSTATQAWSWDALSWTSIGPGLAGGWTIPLSDPIHGRLLAVNAAGVWTWTGGAWSAVTPVLPAVTRIGLAYDPAAGALEAFDATGGVRRCAGGTWSPIAPADPAAGASPVRLDAAAEDPGGGGVLAHEPGSPSGTTWRWNGTGWARVVAGDGLTATSAVLVRDPVRGLTYLDRTADAAYLWSGAGWTLADSAALKVGNLFTSSVPAYSDTLGSTVAWLTYTYRSNQMNFVARYPGATPPIDVGNGLGMHDPLAPDASGRSFLLTPSRVTETLAADLTRTPAAVDLPFGLPPAGAVQASIWDPVGLGVAVAFPGEIWRLESEAASRPGHLFRAAYARSGGPDPTGCLVSPATCPIASVTFAWTGIATPQEGVAATSAAVSAWDGTRFVRLGTVTAPPGVAGSGSYRIADPALIGLLGSAHSGEVTLAVEVLGGPLPAPLVRTDDVSVQVAYRLP